MNTPYRAYMHMLHKEASDEAVSFDEAIAPVKTSLPQPLHEVLDKPMVKDLVDPTRKPMYRISRYVNEHKGDMLNQAASNIVYGLMSNPRGNGPVSLVGGSVGGAIDGVLFKPTVDATIGLLGKGLRAAYGLRDETHGSI